MAKIAVKANLESMAQVTAFVEEQLESMDCPMKIQMQIAIAVDELFSNIARYAYPDGDGEAMVCVEKQEAPSAVLVTFIDRGTPYDPLKKEDPDTTLAAEEREVGGLGIFLVKKSMDDMRYEYRDGQNVLTIVKNLPF